MPDHDLDTSLAAIADHARQTGRLGGAADIRARGDRRRRNQQVASGALAVTLLGALGAGVAFGQSGPNSHPAPLASNAAPAPSTTAAAPTPTPSATRPSTPSTSAPARTTAPAGSKTGDAAILAGQRQVYLDLVQDPDGTVAVDAKQRLDLSDAYGDRALFVLVPNGERFSIKTGKITVGGEPSCLALKKNGSKPSTIVATGCASGDADQEFRLTFQEKDAEGRRTYTIGVGSSLLTWNRYGTDGLIAEVPADAGWEKTTFVLLDQGPAQLPQIGD
jgi:hypothetical protein